MPNHTITNDFGDLDDQSVPDKDLIKVLIATDIHLGYEISTKKGKQCFVLIVYTKTTN